MSSRIRHIVLMKFCPSASTKIDVVTAAKELTNDLSIDFPSLILSIKPIVKLERAKSFTHVLYSEFDSMESMMVSY